MYVYIMIYTHLHTQAMAHFRVSAEKLPRLVGSYPRVVRRLYEDWTTEGERERQNSEEQGKLLGMSKAEVSLS